MRNERENAFTHEKLRSVDLSKWLDSVGDVTAGPDNCSLFAGQVALREM
jgi:hypothetical protein